MSGSILFFVIIGVLVFVVFAKIASRPSHYKQAYQRGQQIAEDHPNLGWRELTDVQNMHEYYFSDDDSINGFWAGYKGLEYNEEGYDPDTD